MLRGIVSDKPSTNAARATTMTISSSVIEDAVPSDRGVGEKRDRDGGDTAVFASATTVIWDVDGTLADSTQLGFTSTNAVLAEAGLDAITLADYMRGTRYPTPQRLAWHATGDTSHESGVELGAAFDRHYIALVSPATAGFFPGVVDVVESLAARGKSQAVLSNACGAYARAVMDVNGVSAHMTRVDGADDAPAAKPAPDGLLAQCDAFGWDPTRCVYVGDSPSDGVAAAAAGMLSVGCTWGAHSAQACEGHFDLLVDNPEQLSRLLLGERSAQGHD